MAEKVKSFVLMLSEASVVPCVDYLLEPSMLNYWNSLSNQESCLNT